MISAAGNGIRCLDVAKLPGNLVLPLAGELAMAVDLEGNIMWLNNETSRMLGGKEPADLLGRNWFETFVPESERTVRRKALVVSEGGRLPEEVEGRIRTLDGRDIEMRGRVVPLRGTDGALIGALLGGVSVSEVRDSKRLLEGLNRLATRWTARIQMVPLEQLDLAISECFAELGKRLDVDAVFLARMSDKGFIEKQFIWSDQAFGGTVSIEGILLSSPLSRLAKELHDEGQFAFRELSELADWPPQECRICKQIGVHSAFVLATRGDSELIEFIALASRQPGRLWLEALIPPLVWISGAIWGAVHRRETEAELRRALAEITRLNAAVEAEHRQLRIEVSHSENHREILGQSSVVSAMIEQIKLVAPTDTSVLILGETGTGKELVANEIHRLSGRRDRRMVTVNCASVPASLAEAELFGREKGAYTDAISSQAGRFEVAHGSTLFLDEVTELARDVQAKLLRVVETGEFERVGSTKPIRVDVRLIAASNRDPAELVRTHRFREDLFYRLNVFPIHVPPLRERREDIPRLVRHLVVEVSESIGKSIQEIPKRTMEALQAYSWPGNVRELRNVIERAVILSQGGVLRVVLPETGPALQLPDATLAAVERQYIVQVLQAVGWRVRGKGGAAEVLDLKPSTLESRMQKLDIERPLSSAD